MTILDILDLIASDTKRKHKEAVLESNRNNDLLKKVFKAAYDPFITYWIAAHPVVETHNATVSLDTAIDSMLETVASRKLTGHAAIEFYHSILESLSGSDAIVLQRIIDRDLRVGVSQATINKIWKKLIPVQDVMLAGKDPSRLKFPNVVVQNKYDGIRCLVTHNTDGSIEMRSRAGNLITCLEIMHDDLRTVIKPGETWDGELVCFFKDGKAMPRKASNGIAYKAIRGTINEKEAELIKFVPWDIVDKSGKLTYKTRLQNLYHALSSAEENRSIIQIQTHKVETLDEIEVLFNAALDAGEEGVIAKNLCGLWEAKRSTNLCKFKAELTCDLIAVDWEEGTGKNKGLLGALVCESSDGLVRVNVGSGYSDEQRQSLTFDNTLGRIIEVLYNARITKKNSKIDSLYHPRFVRFRDDEKTKADSNDEIK